MAGVGRQHRQRGSRRYPSADDAAAGNQTGAHPPSGSPAGDVMVLVWEGVDQDRVPQLLADLLQNPQSEHEHYIATHVIPDLHGADPSAGPPPMMQNVATIET